MNHIIYMAAGNSERFGTNKLLYELDGKPLYRHGLDVLRSVIGCRGDCGLTVITQYEEIASYCRNNGIGYVMNPDSRLGASYTIKAGIRAVEAEEEDFLVFVAADQPGICPQTIERLLEAAKAGTETARICYGDTPGNPVLFSASLIPELNALAGDDGGRNILKGHRCILIQACMPDELADIDLPEDV